MRRPLCAFCLSALGVLVLCSFLPQMGLCCRLRQFCCLLPAGLVERRGRERVCGLPVAGRSAGRRHHGKRPPGWQRYRTPTPEKKCPHRRSGEHRPRLHGGPGERRADGGDGGRETVRFRVECASLPKCEAGGRIRGRFSLDVPDATQRLTTTPTALSSARNICPGMLRLGQSEKLPRPDGVAPDDAEPRPAKRHGRKHRRRSGRDGGGRPEPSDFDSPQCLPGRGAFPCAGGERPPRHHLLRPAGCSAPQGAGAEPGYRRARSLLGPERPFCWWASLARRPLVLRAAVAVWVSSLGVWVGGPADTLTSLGAAGVLMCLGNGYAVYDVGFELSFAAVMGTLAGAECAGRGRKRYYDRKKKRKGRGKKPLPRSAAPPPSGGRRVGFALRLLLRFGGDLPGAGAAGDEHDGLGCGVGRGRPLAGGADAELRPRCSAAGSGGPEFRILALFEIIRRPVAFCAEGLAWLMNEWAFRVSVLPGASSGLMGAMPHWCVLC